MHGVNLFNKLLICDISVLLADDVDVLLVSNHVDVPFVDDGHVLLVHDLLVEDGLHCLLEYVLVVLVDHVDVVLHNHVLVVLVDDVLVDFPHHLLVRQLLHHLHLLLLLNVRNNSLRDVNFLMDVLLLLLLCSNVHVLLLL